MKIVVDSYAWIEIFLGTEKGKSASKAIEDAEQAITPEIVLAEISRKYLPGRSEGIFDPKQARDNLSKLGTFSIG